MFLFFFCRADRFPAFVCFLTVLLLLRHLWVFAIISLYLPSFLPIHHFFFLLILCSPASSSTTAVLTVFSSCNAKHLPVLHILLSPSFPPSSFLPVRSPSFLFPSHLSHSSSRPSHHISFTLLTLSCCFPHSFLVFHSPFPPAISSSPSLPHPSLNRRPRHLSLPL